MGHAAEPTVVYVGLGRLPQPTVAAMDAVAVELEVEASSRRIVAAATNLQFPRLERLLQEVLVGQPVAAAAGHALLELEVRYSASFAPALRTAVQAAVLRAMDGATNGEPSLDGETGGNGKSPRRTTPLSGSPALASQRRRSLNERST